MGHKMNWNNENVSRVLNYENLINILDECTSGCIYVYDLTNDYYTISHKALDIFALDSVSFDNAAEKLNEVIYPDDIEMLANDINRIKQNKSGRHDLEYRWYNKEKKPVWINCRGEAVYDKENDVLYLVGAIEEIGSIRKYDNTTNLYSESMLEKNYFMMDNNSEKKRGYMLLIGVDNFKAVNEKYGVKTGDEVLADIAGCIIQCVGDTKSVYRLSGDEFAILMTRHGTDEEIVEKAKLLYKYIRVRVDNMIKERNYSIFYTISGGADIFESGRDSFDSVIQNARFALHEAKLKGRNTFVAYSKEQYEAYIHKMDIQEHLRSSIINGFNGFEVYYQPIFNTSCNAIKGAEALIRWNSDKYGFMSPVDFIPLLEESSLIIPLGKWIITQAVQQCKKWCGIIPDFTVNINLSFVQVIKSDIVGDAMECITQEDISHKNIVFEVTESGELENNPMVRNVLRSFELLGFKLAIDDFGTGYSNLRYIRDMTFGIIKIDRMFVQNIDSNAENYSLVEYVIDMAHKLGIKVCVEGVETAEELVCVKALGADCIQGYYYGKPMPADEFESKFIRN